MVYPKAVDYLTKNAKVKARKASLLLVKGIPETFQRISVLLVDSQNLRVRFCC